MLKTVIEQFSLEAKSLKKIIFEVMLSNAGHHLKENKNPRFCTENSVII